MTYPTIYRPNENITLYRGDCLDILPTLTGIDAVVTDPPYPGLEGGLIAKTDGVAKRVRPSVTVGTPWGDDLSGLSMACSMAKAALAFCSHASIVATREAMGGEAVGFATWYKRNSQPSFRNRPYYTCEHIWMIEYAPGMNWKNVPTFYDIPKLQAGCMAVERILNDDGSTSHPTQKPVTLMRKLLQVVPEGMTVLDPYMGSGTTGVACIRTGRRFIGIEIDPTHYATACKRIDNELQQMTLPVAEALA